MKEFYVGKAVVGFISDCDSKIIEPYKWRIAQRPHTNYAKTSIYKMNIFRVRYSTTMLMHRLLLAPAKGLQVDHINRNGLDNRRENLRALRPILNAYNKEYKGHSEFFGVDIVYTKNKRHFRARITNIYESKREFLGAFTEETQAALAYDKRARELYGDNFCFNFPDAPELQIPIYDVPF